MHENIIPIKGNLKSERPEAKFPEITFGESVCEKLKNVYFIERKWPDCYKDVGRKFTELKSIAREFYAGQDELAVLRELAKYSEQDLKEMLEINTRTV